MTPRGRRAEGPSDPSDGDEATAPPGRATPGRRGEAGERGVRVPAPGFAPGPELETVDLATLREPGWFNVPNAVTFLRAVLVPVILWLLAKDDPAARWWAFGIFVFAAATDSVDGWVARRWHGVTEWGALADPIADKLLIVGALASLAAVGDLPWWAVIVIATREVAVTVLRVWLIRGSDLVMPASRWGKAKTVSQVLAVAIYLLPGVAGGLRTGALYVAVALTVWSGLEYAFRAARLARAGTAA